MNNQLLPIAVLAICSFGAYNAYQKESGGSPVPNAQSPQEDWSNSDWTQPTLPVTPKPETAPVAPSAPAKPIQINSYNDAVSAAKQTNKKIFLYFHADWCHYCKQMESQTLSDPTVKNALKDYIIYKVDTDKEMAVAKKYKVKGLPSYFIVDSNENVLKNDQGMKNSRSFLLWLNGSGSTRRFKVQPRKAVVYEDSCSSGGCGSGGCSAGGWSRGCRSCR